MRVFNGLRIGSIVIYVKDKQKYKVIDLLENDGRKCKIMSMTNTDEILEVPVELCERIEN